MKKLKHKKLIDAMFLETNPICVKYALSLLKKCKAKLRLPLVKPSKHNSEIIMNLIKKKSFIGQADFLTKI